MKSFPSIKLGEIAKFSQGIQIPIGDQSSEKASNDQVRFIRIVDYTQKTSDVRYVKNPGPRYLVSKSDLVMVRYGPIGVVGKGIVGAIANNMFKVSPDTSIVEGDYLYYCLSCEKTRLKLISSNSSTTMPAITFGMAADIDVPLPGLPAQRKIAGILSAYDELIENNLRRIEILEEMAQSLYREWFVHFRYPGHESARFVDSSLGSIPKGWEVKAASEVAQITIGKTPPRQESQWFTDTADGIPWVSIRDMNQGRFVLNTAEGLTDEAVSKFNVRRVPDGTVLLSFKLTVGRVCLTVGEMLTNEAIAHFVLGDNSLVTPAYLTTYLSNFQFETLGSTSSIGRATNSQVVKQMPILVPHEKIATAFNNLAEPSFSLVRSLMQRNQNLRRTRDLLLPKLLSAT